MLDPGASTTVTFDLLVDAATPRGTRSVNQAIVYTAEEGSAGVCEYVSPRASDILGYEPEAWRSPGFWLSRDTYVPALESYLAELPGLR